MWEQTPAEDVEQKSGRDDEARAKNPAVEKAPAAARGWIGGRWWNMVLVLIVLGILRTTLVQSQGRKGSTTVPSALRTHTLGQGLTGRQLA